jgi:ATP/maltotriose-dependent transcriptional regulator MalT
MLLATVAWFQQDAERCAAYVLANRDRIDAVGDRQTLALALLAQGGSLYATLDHDRAARLLHEAVDVAKDIGDPLAEGTPRLVLACIQIAAGEPRATLEEVRELRERLRAHWQFYYLAWAALTEAIAHAAAGDLPRARAALEPIVTGSSPGPDT